MRDKLSELKGSQNIRSFASMRKPIHFIFLIFCEFSRTARRTVTLEDNQP